MKKGFTLVELLVVVVVIVTLMGVAFRLGGVGSGETARSRTVNRMQRLENCLSGYYAAYGSYPPVALHGRRDYRYRVDKCGIQQVNESREETIDWERVEAACRSQPVGFLYPPSGNGAYIRKVSDILKRKASSSEKRYEKFRNNPQLSIGFDVPTASALSGKAEYSDWLDVQLFQFGLLSYLLPRLLVIWDMEPGKAAPTAFTDFFGSGNGSGQAQWTFNNELPCDFESGTPYAQWSDVMNVLKDKPWKIAALPSQVVCARWMPNLEGILATSKGDRVFYGINVKGRDYSEYGHAGSGVYEENPNPKLYSAGNSQGGGTGGLSQLYALEGISASDGWLNEFYYYSPSPHQSYVLWSAGANGKTFPPWVPAEEIDSLGSDKATVLEWMSDDIMHMKNENK